jgi:hypothetical protein
MVSGNGLAITYTAFNKPETITRGANTIGFAHDTEHQRFKQIAATGETLYLNAGGLMSIIRARSSSENRPPLFGLRAAADRLGRDDAVDRLSVCRWRNGWHARRAFGQRCLHEVFPQGSSSRDPKSAQRFSAKSSAGK